MSVGGSRSRSRQSQSSETAPWKAQQPYLIDIMKRGHQMSYEPLEYYPDATVAERDPYTEAGIRMAASRAMEGSPVTQSARDQAAGTLRGDFLNANPHLDETYNQAAERLGEQFKRITMPTLSGRYAGAGRLGSGAYANARGGAVDELGDQLRRLATDIYGGNYQRERGRQIQALTMAPRIAEQDFREAGALQAAGLAREDYAQRVLDDLVARHDFEQMEPWERLQLYQEAVQAPIMASSSRGSGRVSSMSARASGK